MLPLITGGRTSSILAEMVKVCYDEMLVYLAQCLVVPGKNKVVPQNWHGALLVPVPKKSDLSLCKNLEGNHFSGCGG